MLIEVLDFGGDVIKLFLVLYNCIVIVFGMVSVVEDVVIEGTIWLFIFKYFGRSIIVVNVDIVELKDVENRNLYVVFVLFIFLDVVG